MSEWQTPQNFTSMTTSRGPGSRRSIVIGSSRLPAAWAPHALTVCISRSPLAHQIYVAAANPTMAHLATGCEATLYNAPLEAPRWGMSTAAVTHLQAFLGVARLRSFSAAARELGVSRSAVSQS